MSSFSMVLLEEGVEVELPTSLSDALGLLDQVVPTFSCNNYGYRIGTINRAQVGSNWGLSVTLVDQATNQAVDEPVGCVELEKLDEHKVSFKIPPRAQQQFPGMSRLDWDGKLYGSFIYQMLNTLYDRNLIELPGRLPQV
ncbi:MAG: hypothetical protein VX966_10815 [Chloroflexota bacterium]|nr:hypothetical protein [Chloroflexota bacterium]